MKKAILILTALLLMIPCSSVSASEALDNRITTYDQNMEDANRDAYEMIHAPEAWEQFLTFVNDNNLQPVNVGLIDSAFYVSHPDLKFAGTMNNDDSENLKINFINSVGNLAVYQVSLNDAGIFDIAFNKNKYLSKEAELTAEMIKYTHGTHVAGILGGIHGNEIGINGMYPLADRNGLYGFARINAKNTGNSSQLICDGIQYLLDHDVRVINVSMGISLEPEDTIYTLDQIAMEISMFLNQKLEEGKDFLIVASAGNESEDAALTSPFARISGKAGDHILIAASAETDRILSSYSNRGELVSLAAPGSNITSASPEGYICFSGTSMSAPFVSGTAAMVWNILEPFRDHLDTDLDIGALTKYILEETAHTGVYNSVFSKIDRIGTGTFDYPLLDADAAVDMAIRMVTRDHPSQYITHYLKELAFLYPVMAEHEWWGKQYENENGWLIWQPDWSEEYLSGLLTADIQDYDSDGQDELLAVLFHDEGNLLHEQLLMFEYENGTVQLKAIHDIPVETNLFYDELYTGFRVSTFAYDFNGEKLIAAAYDNYREGGSSVQALYHYNGQDFEYRQGFTISKGSDDSVWCSRTGQEPEMPLSYMTLPPWQDFAHTEDDIIYGSVYEYGSPDYYGYIRSVEQTYENALLEYGLQWNRFNGRITDQTGMKAVNILNKAPLGQLFSGVHPLCDFNLYVKCWEQEGDAEYPEAVLYTIDYTGLLDPYRE